MLKQQHAAKQTGLRSTVSNTTESISNTYHPGQTGHIDLLGIFEQPTITDSQRSSQDHNDDDMQHVTQIADVRAEIYPESMRFRPPATPTTNGRKHNRVGETAADPNTTPRLPANPFAGHMGGLEGMMDGSQLFKATQALSSPLANVLPSDGLSERPSPDMHSAQRPATAEPLSSPAKFPPSNILRSVTEPHVTYISMKESQAERDRLAHMSRVRPGIAGQDGSDDDFDSDDSELRRRRVRRKIDQQTKEQFMGITARMTPARRGRGRGYKARNHRSNEASRPSSREATETHIISSGESAKDPHEIDTEEETEHEDDHNELPIDDVDELGDENKENFATKGIQVPMTDSRTNHRTTLHSPTQSSPTHRLLESPATPQSLEDAGNHAHQAITTTEKSQKPPIETQIVAIADSQSSQSYAKATGQSKITTMPSQVPGSSSDYSSLIPQSQANKANIQAASLAGRSKEERRAIAAPVTLVSSHIPVELSQTGSNGMCIAEAGTYLHGQTKDNFQNDHAGTRHVTQVLGSSPPTAPKESVLRTSGLEDRETVGHVDTVIPRPEGSVEDFPKSVATTEAQDAEIRPEIHYGASGSQQKAACTSVAQSTIPETSSASEGGEVLTRVVTRSLKCGAKQLPDATPADSSNGSTPFETAQSHQVNQDLRSSAIITERSEPIRSPAFPEVSGIRTITEIATAPSPVGVSADVDLDINLLTKEDMEYQNVMDQLSPSRKKRRGNHGRALPVAMPSTNVLPTTRPFSSQDDSGHNDESILTSSEPIRSRPAALQMPCQDTVSNDEEATLTSSEPIRSRPITRRQANESPPTTLTDAIDRCDALIEPEAVVKSSPRGRPRKIKPISTRIQGTASDDKKERPGTTRAVFTSTAPDGNNIQAPAVQPGGSSVVAPNRVFAHFNGNVAGYFPATCIGIVGGQEPRFRVRFDDGTVDVINGFGTRRLELLPGDVVKLDISGARTKNYIVESTQDLQLPTPTPDLETPVCRGRRRPQESTVYPQTDIHGHITVVVSVKHSKSADADGNNDEKISVPVKDVYLTQSMWTHFKNRDYAHTAALDRSISRLQTPSETTSSPSTPSSRTRRFKTAGFAKTLNRSLSARASPGLFENMAFAVTNISRIEDQERIKQQILANGGRILQSGFDELFHIPSLEITSPSRDSLAGSEFEPNETAASLGFTCLIADEHCRRTKYIEALALGIPCLATRWIQDCITKRRILPWVPYLLSSGESAYLGGAVRSRFLRPYNAETANLSGVLATRPKLLDGQSVLLIMSKSEEKTMKSHPLITHALGASQVSRAINVDAAAKAIAAAQANNEPWDWVYSHDNEKEVERQLFGGDKTGKKRKRGGRESGVSRMAGSRGKTKVVGNEFVVQSLILGQLVDME